MSDDDLMSIGSFSFRTGLSIPALRHYDEVGLLTPSFVDPLTGYRRYHPDQIQSARLICGLRAIELPIDEIRELISSDDAAMQAVLRRHRDRLVRRGRTVQRMTATVDEYLEKGVPMPAGTGFRPVQISIHTDDVPKAVAFYSAILDAEFDESITSFLFGVPNTESFFLLTIEPRAEIYPAHPGKGACFGFMVDDLDAAHRSALDAGGTEVQPPMEFEWKPRMSTVDDPSGNRISFFQR